MAAVVPHSKYVEAINRITQLENACTRALKALKKDAGWSRNDIDVDAIFALESILPPAKRDTPDLSLTQLQPPANNVTVVRVRTTYWNDHKGIYSRKAITYLRRKSSGYHLVEEEANNVGAQHAMEQIINLHDVEDGLYEAQVCNVSRDYETGYVDDWELTLKPYTEPTE